MQNQWTKTALGAGLLAATLLLAACGQNQQSGSQASSAAGSGAAPDRSADKQTFVQDCVSGWPQDQRSDAVQQYCSCLADYVIAKYDAETFRRLDQAMRRNEENAEIKAFTQDLADNGLKVCPAPAS